MGFFEKFFAKSEEVAKRSEVGGLQDQKAKKTREAMNQDLPPEQRRQAFAEAKELKDQQNKLSREETEAFKKEAMAANEALKAKYAEKDAAKLEETRKAFEEGVDITDSVDEEARSVDVDFEDEQKAA